jgi:hypothetical protein
MQLLGWAASAIGSAIIGVVLAVLFQDRVADVAAQVLGPMASIGRGRRISGTWFTYWIVVPEATSSSSAKRPSPEIAVIQLRRVGSRVVGIDRHKRRRYVISATLRSGMFLTGTWHDTSNNRYQWGGFQICWDVEGTGMVGKFIGKDSRNHVNHGIWLWARNPNDLPALAEWSAKEGGYKFDYIKVRDSIRRTLSCA